MNKNFSKYYQFTSENNKYSLSLKSILNGNHEILCIKLSNVLKDNIIHFYYEKTLLEIYNEYNNLKEFKSVKSIIEYLCKLISHNQMKIYNINKFIYNIVFRDNNKKQNIKFLLKRKIEPNEKLAEELENEIVNMHKTMENMQNQIKSQNSKYNELEEKYNYLYQKFEEMNKTIRNFNEENSTNNNDRNNIKRSNNTNKIKKVEEIIESKNQKKSSIYESQNDENDFLINRSVSYIKDSNNKIFMNKSINSSMKQIEYYNNEIKQNYIHKENNCEILFSKDPTIINNKKFIMNENSDEECEDFTAFNVSISQPIIAWITKKENKDINILNWASKEIFNKTKNAHNSKINKLQYYHNDIIDLNNEYLLSLSLNDKDTLKIWNIDLISLKLNLVKTIEDKINCFGMFSNKAYSNNNYLITSIKINKPYNINVYKLDNNLQGDHCHQIIDCISKVNFLDVFYHKKNNDIYLINCNNYDVRIIQNPFDNKCESKSFKKYLSHLNAFMYEKDDELLLFESNMEGIIIWDYNNNNSPIKEILLEMPFDLCLWNNNNLWVSTNKGFTLLEIERGEILMTLDINNNDKRRILSKIRKINSPKENESIIGIDSDRKLCLWTY